MFPLRAFAALSRATNGSEVEAPVLRAKRPPTR